MISCDRRRALLTTLILLARMICQTLCWPTLNCFYLSHFVLLFARRCFILQVYIFEYVNVFFLQSCSVQMVNVSPFPQFCTKHFYPKQFTVYCLLFSLISVQLKHALYTYFWSDAEAGQVKNAGHENPVHRSRKVYVRKRTGLYICIASSPFTFLSA